MKSDVQQAVSCGFDGSVKPILFTIQLDHGLLDHTVIRVSAIKWL